MSFSTTPPSLFLSFFSRQIGDGLFFSEYRTIHAKIFLEMLIILLAGSMNRVLVETRDYEGNFTLCLPRVIDSGNLRRIRKRWMEEN